MRGFLRPSEGNYETRRGELRDPMRGNLRPNSGDSETHKVKRLPTLGQTIIPCRYADAIEDEFDLGTVLLWHNYALNRTARPQAWHDSTDC